jgi:hypothetical protein
MVTLSRPEGRGTEQRGFPGHWQAYVYKYRPRSYIPQTSLLTSINRQQMVPPPLSPLGPYHEISSNSHEKLSQQSLRMGDIGLPIYACKDKWSGTLLKVSVVPDCRSAGAIGHLFLDFIEEIGGEGLASLIGVADPTYG